MAEGHDQYHHWYQYQTVPGKHESCCNSKDCRPARAYHQTDGGWMFQLKSSNEWVFVPEAKIIYKTPNGEAHFCGYPVHDGGVTRHKPRCGFIPSLM